MKTLLSPTVFHASLEQVIQKILRTGQITTADQRWLLKANTTSLPLSHEEIQMIQQVCDRLQMGLVRVTD